MPRIKFTDRSVKALDIPESGQVEYFDSDRKLPGFGLRISAGGTKSWILLYRHRGRQRRLTVGRFSVLGLAEARAKAKEALGAVLSGNDPAGRKRQANQAPTFADLAEEYIERHAKPKKRSWKKDVWMLRRYVPPEWRWAKAGEITRQEIRDLLDGMVVRTPTQANRVLCLLRKVYNFGLSRDMVVLNPCHGIERPAPDRQRDRVLTYEELRRVWAAAEDEAPQEAALVKLQLLTAQRSGEVRSLAWRDLDFETAWWTIPAGFVKNKLTHRVPLSAPAVAILEELRAQGVPSEWLFPTRSSLGYRAIMHKVTCRVRDRSGVEFIPHDLRRTAASYMTGFGIPRLVVSKILNHVEQGVTAVYDRYSYDRDKRIALDIWGDALLKIVTTRPGTHGALRDLDHDPRVAQLNPWLGRSWQGTGVPFASRPTH